MHAELNDCTIDLLSGVVTLECGVQCPITNMLAFDGVETADPRECTVCVGALPDGNWFALQVDSDDLPMVH